MGTAPPRPVPSTIPTPEMGSMALTISSISPSYRHHGGGPPTIGGKGNPPPPPVVGYVHRRGRLKPRTTSAEVRQSKGDLYQGSEFYSLELLRLDFRTFSG